MMPYHHSFYIYPLQWNGEDTVLSQGGHCLWDCIVKSCSQSIKTADFSIRLAFSTPKKHLLETPNLQACLLWAPYISYHPQHLLGFLNRLEESSGYLFSG